eukprot:GHVT01028865.1.p2 GENE.GHVT01028865.1~~GHVT01028865.1.p2  ORF type:complete len:209 (+),score=29.99 GHVT01028865.1:1503-2129(+)
MLAPTTPPGLSAHSKIRVLGPTIRTFNGAEGFESPSIRLIRRGSDDAADLIPWRPLMDIPNSLPGQLLPHRLRGSLNGGGSPLMAFALRAAAQIRANLIRLQQSKALQHMHKVVTERSLFPQSAADSGKSGKERAMAGNKHLKKAGAKNRRHANHKEHKVAHEAAQHSHEEEEEEHSEQDHHHTKSTPHATSTHPRTTPSKAHQLVGV